MPSSSRPVMSHAGAWRYDGMDGDSYVYRELLENTVVGAGGYSGQSAADDETRSGGDPAALDRKPQRPRLTL